MLLEKVLNQSPDSAVLLLRRDMYADDEQRALVRDVLALANAVGASTRHLLFGAERSDGTMTIRGLDLAAIDRFRDLTQKLGELVEPRINIAQLFAEVDGKTIAALEISGCDNPPYTLSHRIAEDMRTGACWVRDNEDVRPANREDLDRMYARRAAGPMAAVLVGLNDDSSCLQLLLEVPDTSRPPSQRARAKLLSAINAKKAAERVLGADNTGMARLAHARIYGPDEPYLPRGVDTLVEQHDGADDEYLDADQHYYYEQQAVRLDFTVRSQHAQVLNDAVIDFSLPRVPGFEVADRLYADREGNMTAIESSLAGYPDVKKFTDHATVRVELGRLDPGQELAVFETPLRLHVGSEMRGMKVAVRYSLTATGLKAPVSGRLKLVFRA